MKSPAMIIVYGDSGSGKTTLVNSFRFREDEGIAVPKRYSTRAPRVNDDLVENAFVSARTFVGLVRRGVLDVYWRRGTSSPVGYGFSWADEARVRILSANNAIFGDDADPKPADLLAHAYLVCVHAPLEERERRLAERSPDIYADDTQRTRKLHGTGSNVRMLADLVIDTGSLTVDESRAELERLVRRFL